MNNPSRTPRPLTGKMVLFYLVAFFATVIGVNMMMMKLAIDTLPGTEVDSAYRASLAEAMEAGYALQHRPLLRICVGCTGGWHRSVAMVEALGSALAALGIKTALVHRELAREISRELAREPGKADSPRDK